MKVTKLTLTEAEVETILHWKEVYDVDSITDEDYSELVSKLERAEYDSKYKFSTPNEYDMSSLKSAEEGVFITFHYHACSNMKTQCRFPPTNVLLSQPRPYNQVTTCMEPVCMAFRVSPANLPFLRESIGPARIMQYDIVNEIYYVDNGRCNERS